MEAIREFTESLISKKRVEIVYETGINVHPESFIRNYYTEEERDYRFIKSRDTIFHKLVYEKPDLSLNEKFKQSFLSRYHNDDGESVVNNLKLIKLSNHEKGTTFYIDKPTQKIYIHDIHYGLLPVPLSIDEYCNLSQKAKIIQKDVIKDGEDEDGHED